MSATVDPIAAPRTPAMGRPMSLTAEHDGVLVADVATEWARSGGPALGGCDCQRRSWKAVPVPTTW